MFWGLSRLAALILVRYLIVIFPDQVNSFAAQPPSGTETVVRDGLGQVMMQWWAGWGKC